MEPIFPEFQHVDKYLCHLYLKVIFTRYNVLDLHFFPSSILNVAPFSSSTKYWCQKFEDDLIFLPLQTTYCFCWSIQDISSLKKKSSNFISMWILLLVILGQNSQVRVVLFKIKSFFFSSRKVSSILLLSISFFSLL